jgi:aminoglycoside phosphotransferase
VEQRFFPLPSSPLSAWTAPSDLVVTDVDALVEYVASVGDHYEAQIDIPWAEVVSRFHDLASAAMSTDGELRFSTGAGAFICR